MTASQAAWQLIEAKLSGEIKVAAAARVGREDQRLWYGKIFALFRGWMVPGIRRRFGHGEKWHVDQEMLNSYQETANRSPPSYTLGQSFLVDYLASMDAWEVDHDQLFSLEELEYGHLL